MKTAQNENQSTANAPWNDPDFVNAKRDAHVTPEAKKPMSLKKKAAAAVGAVVLTAGIGAGIHAAGDRADNEGGKVPTQEQVDAAKKGLEAVEGTADEPAPTGIRTAPEDLPPAELGDSTTQNLGEAQVSQLPEQPAPTETTQPNGQ